MAKGTVYAAETTVRHDSETGVRIRQVTSHDSIHHHPFYYIPAYDDAMRWLFFVSHRTGSAQVFVEERESGDLIQLTDRDDLNEWSLHPSHDGRHVYFTSRSAGWRLDMNSLQEEQLIAFGDAKKAAGMVGAGMGTTTLSKDDRWWAIPVRRENAGQLMVVDTSSGETSIVCENESVGHPQFHPQDANLLRYGGPYNRRIWVTNRDGSDHRLIYQRDESKKEWIVHECWRPHRREILTANWPHGVMLIDIETGKWRWVTRFNAWHPMVDPSGTYMIADTKNPDIGLQRFHIAAELSSPQLLCRSNSTNVGEHWNTDHCPYDDGPVDVYAPQHTHPHPSISPHGQEFVYTSGTNDRSQILVVTNGKPTD